MNNDMNQNEIDWVSKRMACHMIGITERTLDGWKSRHLTRGLHYQVIGKQTLINLPEMNKWIKTFGQKTSDQEAKGCKSEYGKAANARTRKRSLATPTLKLI